MLIFKQIAFIRNMHETKAASFPNEIHYQSPTRTSSSYVSRTSTFPGTVPATLEAAIKLVFDEINKLVSDNNLPAASIQASDIKVASQPAANPAPSVDAQAIYN